MDLQGNPQLNNYHYYNINIRADPQVIMTVDGRDMKVCIREYFSFVVLMRVWVIGLTFITTAIVDVSLLGTDFKKYAVSFLLLASSSFITWQCWQYRKTLKKIVLSLSFYLSVFSFLIVLFINVQVPSFTVAGTIFCLLLLITGMQTIKSLILKVMLVLLIIQMVVVSAKAEELIELSWKTVLFPIMPLFMGIVTALILTSIYALLQSKLHPQNFKAERQGIKMILSAMLVLSSSLAVLIGSVYLNLTFKPLAILSISSMATLIPLYIFTTHQAAISFCKNKSLVKIMGDVQMEIRRRKQGYLYIKQSCQFEQQENDHYIRDLAECQVCNDEKAEIVWLPCSHLTLCSLCSQNLKSSIKLKCILCHKNFKGMQKIGPKQSYKLILNKELGLNPEEKVYQISEKYQIMEC